MKVYFAHPTINNRKSRKIKKILERRGLDVVDPLCQINQNERELVAERDRHLLKQCDIVVVWMPKSRKHRNIGTSIEMYWGWKYDKEVIVISYKTNAFIRKFAEYLYLSIKDFENEVFEYL